MRNSSIVLFHSHEGIGAEQCGDIGGLPHLEVMSPNEKFGAPRLLDEAQIPPSEIATQVVCQEVAHGQELWKKDLFRKDCPREVYLFSLRISLGYGVSTGLTTVGTGLPVRASVDHGTAQSVAVVTEHRIRSASREQLILKKRAYEELQHQQPALGGSSLCLRLRNDSEYRSWTRKIRTYEDFGEIAQSIKADYYLDAARKLPLLQPYGFLLHDVVPHVHYAHGGAQFRRNFRMLPNSGTSHGIFQGAGYLRLQRHISREGVGYLDRSFQHTVFASILEKFKFASGKKYFNISNIEPSTYGTAQARTSTYNVRRSGTGPPVRVSSPESERHSYSQAEQYQSVFGQGNVYIYLQLRIGTCKRLYF